MEKCVQDNQPDHPAAEQHGIHSNSFLVCAILEVTAKHLSTIDWAFLNLIIDFCGSMYGQILLSVL